MFEVLSSEIVKMPEVNPNDRTYTSKQRNAKSKSPDQQHKENHSFTGWTNVDSLNGSQIAQETQRNANIIIVPHKVIEILPKNLPEKTREVSIEPPTMQDLKRKLWIDVTREKPYEESLRSYPKIVGDNYPRFSRVSSLNRVSTALTPQRTELNVISIHYASSKSRQSPLGFATSPRLQQLRSTKQNSPHPSQGVQNSESIQQLKSNSKTLDINTSSEAPATIKDFSLFRALALTPNPEKRAVTALKKRHSEGLSSPITVVGVGKGIKLEDTKKTKNLKLSKALSLWSHVTSPAIVNSVNTVNTVKSIKTQPDEGGVKSTNVLSLEATESSTSGKNPGNPIPTKMLNFIGSGGNEIKYLVPLPHFKPTIKVKRPADAEKNEADTKMFTKTEAVKMRVTSPVNLYTKDWDTLNGFPRKVSREVVHKSELKRRPFDEAYGDDYRPSETLNINTSSNSEAKETGNNQSRKDSLFQKIAERRSNTIVFESRPRTKEHSLESKQEILIVNKAPGISVVKIIGKIAVDEKKAKKHQKRLSKGMRTSESPDSSKESVEKKQEPNKTREVKNFKLF